MYYPCSENKGADQLRGYREADLRLCFHICKKPVFSRRGSYFEFHGCHNDYFQMKNSDSFYFLPVLLYKSSVRGAGVTKLHGHINNEFFNERELYFGRFVNEIMRIVDIAFLLIYIFGRFLAMP